MGRKPNQSTQEAFLEYLRSGRDEMNLLEHSISSAGTQVDRKTTSLLFESQATDPETGEPVEQSWEVTFSGKFGRPTATDDDVFVALMKVTHEQDFASPHVEFTSYQLIRILGWPDSGPSYKAIDNALNRLCGVRVVAKNYWYDNKAKLWVDRKFGVIDDVFLYERAKYDRAKRKAKELGESNPKSWLRWSDVMQESFAAGYIRKLDIEVYRDIENPVARKLYRYLGKHFWKKRQHRIELAELAVEKLGYKQETALRELRRRLAPAIAELEAKGIYGLSHEFKSSYGKCQVLFTQTKKTDAKPSKPEHPLVAKLRAIGVFEADARAATTTHSEQRILEDIEDVEFRAKQGQVRASKAGLLSKLLKEETPARPEGFVSSFEKSRQRKLVAEKRAAEQRAEAERQAAEAERIARQGEAFDLFYRELGSEAAQAEFAREAIAANTFYRDFIRKAKQAGEEQRASSFTRDAMMELWKKRVASTPQAELFTR
ncbi:replication initiator protein A [Botrimarina mediterranea]|uniref:replication initiator protein A n=1 Tax=Botrimarina mediterranea TaxID=2528022 RepID=UPI001189F7A0|nr:Replication initiator protein A [Planctomycetes bacterium K2D]